MAPAPEGSGGGFRLNLSKPGAKEYLLVGGLALGGGLLYFWWKNRQSAAAPAAATGSGTSAPSTPTGLSTSQLLAWIHDHSTSTTKTTTAPGKKTTIGTVPDVVGRGGEEAGDAIRSAGYRPLQTPPATAKGKHTIVTSQNPAGGRKMARGGTVAYNVKLDQGARA
jgi:hypothetical protein